MNDELFFFWRTPVCPTIPSHTYVRKRRARVSFDVRICVRSRTHQDKVRQYATRCDRTFGSKCTCIATGIIYHPPTHTHTQHLSCTIYVYTHTHTHLFAKEELRGNHTLKATTMTTSTISRRRRRRECQCVSVCVPMCENEERACIVCIAIIMCGSDGNVCV